MHEWYLGFYFTYFENNIDKSKAKSQSTKPRPKKGKEEFGLWPKILWIQEGEQR